MLSVGIWGCSALQAPRDVLFQTSTIDALLAGVYDGEITFKELKEHGDFGLGTFNGLDGEMVGLDGNFYKIKVDGNGFRRHLTKEPMGSCISPSIWRCA